MSTGTAGRPTRSRRWRRSGAARCSATTCASTTSSSDSPTSIESIPSIPKRADQAAELDRMSFATWLDSLHARSRSAICRRASQRVALQRAAHRSLDALRRPTDGGDRRNARQPVGDDARRGWQRDAPASDGTRARLCADPRRARDGRPSPRRRRRRDRPRPRALRSARRARGAASTIARRPFRPALAGADRGGDRRARPRCSHQGRQSVPLAVLARTASRASA